MPISRIPIQYFLIALLNMLAFPAYAEPLSDAINTEQATNNAAIQSQKTIDKLSDKTQKMLEQYRSASHQTKTLITYNQHLKDLLNSQETEKTSLEQQLKDIENTQREIIPLILRMLDNLDQFITLDLPFLPEERKQRLSKLKAMMVRADVTHAEKFRRIIEAYQIENDYGNTIEAYRADLTLNDVSSSVDFLRLGRVALYYQRLDGSETGYWNKEQKQWQALPSDYRNAIRNGLRMARKETAPDLLTLPIPVPEAGE
jgi:septal ring factor EnvC (AmiA/AmiB activator)